MTHEDFDRLVRDVEAGIGRDPAALRRKLLGLALLGYAGLMVPLALVLAVGLAFIIPGIIWPQDALPCLVIGAFALPAGAWAAGRVLWVRLSPPEGRVITRVEAPALFAVLDGLRLRLRSAPFQSVLAVSAFNAAVTYRPRLGVFGWNRNYLLLGLPLMESLSPGEFTAVLAHECAHLSKQHHRTGQWIYRLRRSWEQAFEKLTQPRTSGEISLRPMALKFINWFWPRFNAHAFVLSRLNEYQADAIAAREAGSGNAATALIRIAWYGRVLDKTIWPEVWQSANSSATPPEGVFLRLARSLTGLTPDREAGSLAEAFRTTTTNADTHPCLSDRLRAIGSGLDPEVIIPTLTASGTRPNAAETMLGAALPAIRADVERSWRKSSETRWRQLHSKAGVLQERLTRLDHVMAAGKDDVDALWDKARMILELQNPESAAPLLRQILSRDPRHSAANFNLGAILLKSGDAAGEACLELAIEDNEELLPQAANLLHPYFQRTGQADRIKELYSRMDRYEKSLKASRLERNHITAADAFIAHDLPKESLAALRAVMEGERDVLCANLARKELHYFARQRLYLLCVRLRRAWHRLPNADREQAVINRLTRTVRLPGRVFIFSASGDFRSVARKVCKVAGSRIHSRN